ncbi:hypothetical protein [Dichotomicrobium thermohalophilum]|uniref:hypothetical protein n=1 Tax=Dichotomicrobium thermohalophilum TaxID=933063 RepID=UPI000E5C0F76|nr:hypothetical protein [Dichotomicrobium thermohalophilum]
MKRLSHEIAELGRGLPGALLIAGMIFQAVVGSAHLAFAAAATDGSRTPVICALYGDTPPGAPSEKPGGPSMPGTMACPVCASNHHVAGGLLPQLASIPKAIARRDYESHNLNDQWPNDRQPRLVNCRAPPRA